MKKLYNDYDIPLETIMEELRKMHIGMKSNRSMNEKEVIMIDLENEDNNNNISVLDRNLESHIRHFAWANDLSADRLVNLFTQAKKKKKKKEDMTRNNINDANSTP